MKCFRVNIDETITEVKTEGALKEKLNTEECYIIVSNEYSPLISKVLELRQKNASLEDISQVTNLTPYKVQRILERKL